MGESRVYPRRKPPYGELVTWEHCDYIEVGEGQDDPYRCRLVMPPLPPQDPALEPVENTTAQAWCRFCDREVKILRTRKEVVSGKTEGIAELVESMKDIDEEEADDGKE